MISFFLTLLRLLKAIYRAADDDEFRALAFMTTVLLLSATLYYNYAEGWSALDSLYFSVMTMTTIGYGDLVPTTNASKIFTIIYAFLSIGVFVALAAKLAAALFKHRTPSMVRRGET